MSLCDEVYKESQVPGTAEGVMLIRGYSKGGNGTLRILKTYASLFVFIPFPLHPPVY
jgi:hypothetical protein